MRAWFPGRRFRLRRDPEREIDVMTKSETHGKFVRVGLAVAGSLAVAGGLWAVPPNDDCGQATAIAGAVTPFCTIGATTDGPELPPTCDGTPDSPFIADIWFSYVATVPGTVCVSTCGVVDFDTRLAVYTGACGQLTLVACNDDAPGCDLGSELTFSAMPGVAYRIRLGGYSSRGCGSLVVSQNTCATCPPSRHDCLTVGSPGCTDTDCCLTICAFDPFCCAVEWDVMCVDEASVSPACTGASYSCAGVESGVANDCAPYCLELAPFSSVAFDTSNATTDGPPTDCDYGKDIWYCVMAPGIGQLTASVSDAAFDPIVALYDVGANTAFDPDQLAEFLLQCGNARTDGDETITLRTTKAGAVYLIQVAGAASSLPGQMPGSGTGTLRVRFDVPLFSTGPTAPALYDAAGAGAFSLSDMGFATGRLAPGAPLAWFAQPFSLPGDSGLGTTWSVSELHISGCALGGSVGVADCVAACAPGGDDCAPPFVANETLNIILWTRSGSERPESGDQIASIALPFPQPNELVDSVPRNEDLVARFDPPLVLPTGDYYVTAYATNANPNVPSAIVWLTNATGEALPFLDSDGHPFVYRSNGFPQPGFAPYALDASSQLAQAAGLDPDKLYSQGFALLGGPSGFSSCQRASFKLDAAAAELRRAKSKTASLPASPQSAIQMLAQQIFVQNSAARGLLEETKKQLLETGDSEGDECVQFDVKRVVNKLTNSLPILDAAASTTATLIADQDVTSNELDAAKVQLTTLFKSAIALIELIEQQVSGCPPDFTHDGQVDAADLAILLGNWGGSGTGDLDEDGVISGSDLGILLGAWGPCGG